MAEEEKLISLERLSDYNKNIMRDANILKRSTAYSVDNIVNKGLVYLKCTQSGTTSSTTLSLTGVQVGDILTDGTARWEVLSINGVPEGGGGTGEGLEDWESNHDYAVGDIYVYEGQIYKTLVKFASGATEDERIEINDIVPSVWEENTSYTAGDIIGHTDVTTLKKVYYNVTDDFTSGATFEVTEEMEELQITEEYVPNPLTHSQVQNLINNFVPSGSGTDPIFYNDTPIGTIIAYMGITAPKDYLACDGTIYNIVDYKELAEYIKVQFGSYNYFGGDGVDTFAVPDLRGEFLRGTGTNSHTNQGSGDSVGVHQDASSFPDFWYIDTDNRTVFTPYKTGRQTANYDSYQDSTSGRLPYFLDATFTKRNDTVTEQRYLYTSRPTNTSVLYCIKYNTSVLSTPENNYSTEEQRIGTWIDGKPLYQKTIVDTMPIVTTDKVQESKYIEVGVSVDTPVWYEIIRIASNNSSVIIPTAPDTEGYYCKSYFYSNSSSSEPNTIGLFSNVLSQSGQTVYITIKYTKTTD